jgi:hypothetical protein
VSIDLKVSGLGFISTSVLLRLGVELVDSLYASNDAKSGFGRLSGDVWRVLYEQGGGIECVGWRYRLAGFKYVVVDARRNFFKKGQEMTVNTGLWLAGGKASAVFLPHKSGHLKSSPLVLH